MPKQPYTNALLQTLNDEIASLQQQVSEREEVAPAGGVRKLRPPPVEQEATSASSVSAQEIVQALNERVFRLGQVRDWIAEDNHLAQLIDSVIGRQVRQSERRLARMNMMLNTVFLFGGWFLSLLGTPASLVMLVLRR